MEKNDAASDFAYQVCMRSWSSVERRDDCVDGPFAVAA
jgi:hypothetical protein